MKIILIVLVFCASCASMNRMEKVKAKIDSLNVQIDNATGQKGFVAGTIRNMIQQKLAPVEEQKKSEACKETQADGGIEKPHGGSESPALQSGCVTYREYDKDQQRIEEQFEEILLLVEKQHGHQETEQDFIVKLVEGLGALLMGGATMFGAFKTYQRVKANK